MTAGVFVMIGVLIGFVIAICIVLYEAYRELKRIQRGEVNVDG